MEDDVKKNKMEDNLKKIENGFFFEKLEWRPKKNGRQPQKKWKWKMSKKKSQKIEWRPS